MSEYLNNHTRRQAALKEMIGQLHAGKTVDEVKPQFADLLQQVDGAEIAMLEQALIAGGMPPAEIKRLCDVHVAAFQESLDAQPKAQAGATHPLAALRIENAAAGEAADALEAAVARGEWAAAYEHLVDLRRLERHYLNKENILFPYLEKHAFSGPTKVMWSIHDDIRAMWKKLGAALAGLPPGARGREAGQVAELAAPLVRAVRDMFYKEENILFPTALQLLTEPEWQAIGLQFAGAPEAEVALPAESLAGPAPSGLIPLQVGALTAQQIALMLTNLPVDVTFVDENDEVRFFSATRERIFERTPATIGRKVQQCHPPASVHRVQRILDDFRADRRDEAAFWIQMGPAPARFIHIRYFALRDPGRRYLGALEVTQDVTEIRALAGERRLIEEGE